MSPLRDLGADVNESELRVDYHNGGQVRLYGADNADALRGIYLDGVVLDEYGDMDPRVWAEVIRPALADRRGWAVFIGTPKGRNDFYKLWKRSQSEDDWFSSMLKASETGLISTDELQLARRDLSEDQYAQEFECSFDAAIVGSYYGKLINQAEKDKRISGVPYEPTAEVWTAWDLGIRDATAIWFAQTVGKEVRLIDYYEASGADLGHYVREIKSKPYVYGGHIVPHDAQAKELGTGKTRLEVLESLGLKNVTVAPMHRVEDGINAARVFIPKCWFDAVKCERGVECLKLYRAEYDDKLQALKPRPVHDYTSHAADAFRYLAMTLDKYAVNANFNRNINYPKVGIA
jgi:phage terminase large subunit